MSDLNKLFLDKKYKEIIDLTKDSKDYSSLAFRINAFINLNDIKSAINVIKTNNDIIYNNDPIKCMNLHFELLIEDKNYLDAYKALEFYKEKPYISQKVEEFLKEVPNRISYKEQRNAIDEMINDEDKVNNVLKKESEPAVLLNVIYSLKQYDINPYLDSLIFLLTRDNVTDECKAMDAFLLIYKKINKELKINIHQKEYKFNPSKTISPFADKRFASIKDRIGLLTSKEPSLGGVAITLLNQYALNSFLNNTFDSDTDLMAIAFVSIAKRYLKEKEDSIKEFILKNNADIDTINALTERYNKIINNNN